MSRAARRAAVRFAVAAAALLGTGGLAVPLAGLSPAAAAPTHVAIVIAGDKSLCVPWQSGMTGDSLLNSVAQVTYRKDGLITEIDGRPPNGTVTNSTYWAYWHNVGGRWAYSSVGASQYSVPAGSVEGWIYGDGSAPPSGSYAAICAGADPTPQPAGSGTPATRTSTAVAGGAGSSGAAGSGGGTGGSAGSGSGAPGGGSRGGASGGSSAGGGTHAAAGAAGSRAAAAATSSRAAQSASASASAAASTSASASQSTAIDATPEAGPHRSSGRGVSAALPAALVTAAVAALLGGAVWQRRRQAR